VWPELAEIDVAMRRLQRRAQALVAVNGHGLGHAREDMSAVKRRKARSEV
jgi:hypothetical protein